MDFVSLLPVLKWFGVGAGGTGIVLVGYLVWLHITVVENKKKACNNKSIINEHCIVLTELEINQKNMDKKLEKIDANVTKLVDYHLNGRRTKK